jgi:hypothetical protein
MTTWILQIGLIFVYLDVGMLKPIDKTWTENMFGVFPHVPLARP